MFGLFVLAAKYRGKGFSVYDQSVTASDRRQPERI
jgi:hypothetical protein